MDVVHSFNNELHSLLEHKPPVSKAKMGLVTKAAMRGVKYYKHIVQSVEKFVAKCRPDYKLSGLYVIDSIVRQSRHQFGVDRDLFVARFSRNIGITFEYLFADCPAEDKPKMVRVLNLWQRNRVFDVKLIRSLLLMADPIIFDQSPRDPKTPSSGGTSTSVKQEFPSYHRNDYSRHMREDGEALKFSKNMLDFDYGDEEGDADETPTEAEPLLSSTLSKIEMEQRARVLSSEGRAQHQSNHRQVNALAQPLTTDQDPVLDRWNRILRGDISPQNAAQITLNNHYVSDHRRSRSRSPTKANLQRQQQQSLQSQQDSPTVSTGSVKAERDISKVSDKPSGTAEKSFKIGSERSKERELKGLPLIRDLHLTVCSSTLWLGHVPKSVSEADISDAFGEFGTISSIDLIPPRGCAYICMDRRQDAKRALKESRRLKLKGSPIKMAWAPGKGLQEHKKLKDFWESDVGASFIPYTKLDDMIDFDRLEEGGVIDEDSISMEMLERRERKKEVRAGESSEKGASGRGLSDRQLTSLPMYSQPPPLTSTLQSFAVPPPSLALGIPPPLLVGGQGVIPFPPPSVGMTSPSSHRLIHPPIFVQSTPDSSEPRDHDYSMVDHQNGMFERQVVSMIQQGQALGGHPNPGFLYHPNQPNPMIFDLRPQHQQMIHVIHPMLDPHNPMAMFDGQTHPMLIGGQHLSMTHMNHDPSNIDENLTKQQHREF